MTEQYRQGDVFILRIDRIPDEAQPQYSPIIVRGETTGHAHRLVGGEILRVALTNLLYLACTAQAQVVHEDHATITLPPGLYEVRRQREYHPDEIRLVED
jgi:hypothetical protein